MDPTTEPTTDSAGSAASDSDVNQTNIPWILLLVVIVMVAVMAVIVVYLWMRRKMLREVIQLKKASELNPGASNQVEQQMDPEPVAGRQPTLGSMPTVDYQDQDHVEGMKTGNHYEDSREESDE